MPQNIGLNTKVETPAVGSAFQRTPSPGALYVSQEWHTQRGEHWVVLSTYRGVPRYKCQLDPETGKVLKIE